LVSRAGVAPCQVTALSGASQQQSLTHRDC
jgi:hypothetical protein